MMNNEDVADGHLSKCVADLGCAAGNSVLQYVWDGKIVQALDEVALREGGDHPRESEVGEVRERVQCGVSDHP